MPTRREALAAAASVPALLSAGLPAPADGVSWRIRSRGALDAALEHLHAHLNEPGRPGAMVAILESGEVTYLNGWGLAQLEFGIPWTPEIRKTFYSVTKTIVAAAFLILEDEGSIRLDDPFTAYVKGFPEQCDAIKIRDLLTLSSGLRDVEVRAPLGVDAYQSLDQSFAIAARNRHLNFPPGSTYAYGETDYRVAARVLEAVVGTEFGVALSRLVFRPAGMTSAAVASDPYGFELQAPNYVTVPDAGRSGNRMRSAWTQIESSGDGAALGSMNDLIALAQFLSRPGPQGGARLIDRLATPVARAHGMRSYFQIGVDTPRHRGVDIVAKSGWRGTQILHVPSIDAWILTQHNGDDAKLSAESYHRALLDALFQHRGLEINGPGPQLWGGTRAGLATSRLGPFVGEYFEPLSGYVLSLTVEGGLCTYQLLGGGGTLLPEDWHSWVSDASSSDVAVKIFLADTDERGEVQLLIGEWPSPRRLAPAETRLATEAEVRELIGIYRSPEFGILHELALAPESGDLLLLVNGGLLSPHGGIRFRRVGEDVWQSDAQDFPPLLRVERRAGKPSGYRLTSNTWRKAEWTRLS